MQKKNKRNILYIILSLSILFNIGLLFISAYLYKRYYSYTLKTVYHSRATHQPKDIALMGNSITANWINLSPSFFTNLGLANLGISGNTSEDILLRFRHDVVDQGYKIIVLNIGINDICQSNYDSQIVINNLNSVIDLCKLHNVELVLTSVLPSVEHLKISHITTFHIPEDRILALNRDIEKLAEKNSLQYIDYTSKIDREDYLTNQTYDGIHPNEKGYQTLEKILSPYLIEIVNKNKEGLPLQ